MARRRSVWLFTCEHARAAVPTRYRSLFAARKQVLGTHAAYDIGALAAARWLAKYFGASLFEGAVTRLLVDLNRSPWHRELHSEWTAPLAPAELAALRARYYQPFRDEVAGWLDNTLQRHAVVHVSVHSFTPYWLGADRRCDLGVLYDPRRRVERSFADRLCAQARQDAPGLRVRRNFPYRGIADGHVTALRKRFPTSHYVALELELSQALTRDTASARALARQLAGLLEQSLAD